MSVAHEAFVARRFDDLAAHFRPTVEPDDFRLRAVIEGLRPVAGVRLLDLGCGKGRFATRMIELGMRVIGLDPSSSMLAAGAGVPRVRGTARRLPFADGAFDGAYAIEVFEHLSDAAIDEAIGELARVVRPGGRVVIVDKNRSARDVRRPWLPASLVKRIDEHRGRWMYRPGEPVRERWFSALGLARRLARHFDDVLWQFLLRPEEEADLFRRRPSARRFLAWTGVAR